MKHIDLIRNHLAVKHPQSNNSCIAFLSKNARFCVICHQYWHNVENPIPNKCYRCRIASSVTVERLTDQDA